MQFCERYAEIITRFDRYWEGADTDRPVMFVTVPKDDPDASAEWPRAAKLTDRFTPEFMLAQARAQVAHAAYAAEGFPHFWVNFGPGILHACIGGELAFSSDSPETTWFPSFLSDIEEFTGLRFEPEGKWWTQIMACTNALLDEAGDQIVVGITDIGGNADILAGAVGTQQLLLDVLERPGVVKAALADAHELWMEAYEANCAAFAGRQDVTSPWWPILSRGRTYMTQCDLNALISPKVFSDLFVDELGATWSELDNGAYHLDGIGTEVQVPALLAQEGLQCIQWVPEPGTSALKHAKMLRAIQEAGVSVTFGITPDEVEQACRELDPRRLYLVVYPGCESEQEARELVENALRWCE